MDSLLKSKHFNHIYLHYIRKHIIRFHQNYNLCSLEFTDMQHVTKKVRGEIQDKCTKKPIYNTN